VSDPVGVVCPPLRVCRVLPCEAAPPNRALVETGNGRQPLRTAQLPADPFHATSTHAARLPSRGTRYRTAHTALRILAGLTQRGGVARGRGGPKWTWGARLGCVWLLAVAWCVGSATPGRAADPLEAERLFQRGQYAECLEQATAALQEKNPLERWRLLKLRTELELGRYADALATYEAALGQFPQSLELRWWGRQALRFGGRHEQAGPLEQQMLQSVQQAAWRYSDPASRLILGHLLLQEGLEPKRVLEGTYQAVQKQQPTYVPAWLAAGELALDKTDDAFAAEQFRQAIRLDPQNPAGHFGLARALERSDAEGATAALEQTLTINPRHIPGLLLAADNAIDAENYPAANERLNAVLAVNPQHPVALALRGVLAHLGNDAAGLEAARAAALGHWSTNPEVDHVLGRKLSQKYRFAEGAAAQRRALEFNPKYLPARLQLAQDLLRLGSEAEGWELVQEVADADGYNLLAYNLQTLHESVDHFRTLTGDGVVLRMEPGEAEMFGSEVLGLLERARRELCGRYRVELAGPVLVEMFPRQSDFAIRTFGMPGGAGFLGVCFGSVITALSPSATEDPTNWQATLWHEFCHAVTLGKTRNRLPRWLSEGISVYEERRADPAWGQSLNPRYRQMLLDEGLPRVSQLSGSFLRPASPLHLQFAYFESSLVVEWLVERHGFSGLLAVLDDLGRGLSQDEALTRLAGSVAAVDAEFAEYARNRARQFAPAADWSTAGLPDPPTVGNLREFLQAHPANHAGWKTLARLQLEAGDWGQAELALRELARLHPDDAAADGLHPMRARVARERGDAEGERAALERWVELSAAPVEALQRLGEMHIAAGRWEPALAVARRWLAVAPHRPAPHRLATQSAGALRDWRAQVSSLRALSQLQPPDPAGLQLQLGRAWLELEDLEQARRAALRALENTPRYRAAQQLLLEIVRRREAGPGTSGAAAPQESGPQQAGPQQAGPQEVGPPATPVVPGVDASSGGDIPPAAPPTPEAAGSLSVGGATSPATGWEKS